MKDYDKMKQNSVEEASVAGNVKGFAQGGAGMVRRKNSDKANHPFDDKIGDPIENPDLFETVAIAALLANKTMSEVVRKRGSKWVLYDDDTDTMKGTYDDRDTAWEKQRVARKHQEGQKKSHKTDAERKKAGVPRVDTPEKAKTAKEAPKAQKAPEAKAEKMTKKQTTRKESIFDNLLKPMLTEGSMVSYVFENSPMSEESETWQNFIEKLSKQTVMSDPKLNKILHYIAKTELLTLRKAAETVKNTLEKGGRFEVAIANKIERDNNDNDFRLGFVVHMQDNNQKVQFAIKLDNNKPLLLWDEARALLDDMANDECKLLRAELIHTQETTFKHMDDILVAIEKRDSFLAGMEKKFDKFLSNIGPLEMALLKTLLKEKYKTVR
jgi:hypothetical protein